MTDSTESPDLQRRSGLTRLKEGTYGGFFAACAAITLLTTVAIVATLLSDAVVFFSEVPVREFLFSTDWSPNPRGGGQTFGIVPLVIGTLTVTITAAFIALPVGTLTAIYLSEYATANARSILKPLLEVLAGIPTVVYGYFALVYVTPILDAVPGIELGTFNALSASLVMGIMIIPMVSSISEDSMSAVPDSLRNASYGLGSTKFDVSTGVVVPSAASGIASSFILAISRAVGETMIVVVAAGQTARFPGSATELLNSFFQSTQTMTSAIVQLGLSDLAGGTTAYRALFAIGLVLFVMTLVLNLVSDVLVRRYQEDYE